MKNKILVVAAVFTAAIASSAQTHGRSLGLFGNCRPLHKLSVKKLVYFLVLLLCGVALAQDQLPTPRQVCASGTTCAFASNVVSGNLLFVMGNDRSILSTPTDTLGTSFTQVATQSNSSSGWLWCGVLGSSGPDTVTLNGTLSFQGQISIEFPASFGITCTKDASVTGATGAGSGTLTTSALTTAQNGDLLLCFMTNNNTGATMIPTAGGSLLSIMSKNGTTDASGAGYRWAGTNGSYTCSFDNSGTGSGGVYIFAAFKPSTIAMVTTALPTGALGNSYSYTPQCVGGAGAYTWSASSLPTGLGPINSSTGAITGTPTGPTKTPTIQCTDGSVTATLNSAPLTVNNSINSMSVVSSIGMGQSGTTGSLGTVTAGSCIVVSRWFNNGVSLAAPAVTDTLGTNFIFVGRQQSAQNSLMANSLWYGVTTSTGSDTVTAVGGNFSTGAWAAVPISNCQGFADIALSNTGSNAGSVTLSGSALTTLAPGSEIWATVVGGSSSGTSWTAGTGFVLDATVANQAMAGVHANESTVGSYTPSFNQTGNTDGHWAIWGIALRPSTSGVVSTNLRHRGQIF